MLARISRASPGASVGHFPPELPEIRQRPAAGTRLATGGLDTEVPTLLVTSGVLLEVAPVDPLDALQQRRVEAVLLLLEEPSVDETLASRSDAKGWLRNWPGVDVAQTQRPVDRTVLPVAGVAASIERKLDHTCRQAAERDVNAGS